MSEDLFDACVIRVIMGDAEDYVLCMPHGWVGRLRFMPSLRGDLNVINAYADAHREDVRSRRAELGDTA